MKALDEMTDKELATVIAQNSPCEMTPEIEREMYAVRDRLQSGEKFPCACCRKLIGQSGIMLDMCDTAELPVVPAFVCAGCFRRGRTCIEQWDRMARKIEIYVKQVRQGIAARFN